MQCVTSSRVCQERLLSMATTQGRRIRCIEGYKEIHGRCTPARCYGKDRLCKEPPLNIPSKNTPFFYLHSFLLPAFSSNPTFQKTLSTMANVTFTATDAPVLTFSTSRISYKQAGCILQGGRPFMSSCTLQGGRPFMSSCSLQYN